MTIILQTQPQDEPVFQFMDKKRSEGKPYKVYMMASANKFLRIYYARVKAVMDSENFYWPTILYTFRQAVTFLSA